MKTLVANSPCGIVDPYGCVLSLVRWVEHTTVLKVQERGTALILLVLDPDVILAKPVINVEFLSSLVLRGRRFHHHLIFLNEPPYRFVAHPHDLIWDRKYVCEPVRSLVCVPSFPSECSWHTENSAGIEQHLVHMCLVVRDLVRQDAEKLLDSLRVGWRVVKIYRVHDVVTA